MDPEVRRSVVRICFHWKEGKKGYEVMIIPGFILSIENGKATIAIIKAFFKYSSRCVINFPNASAKGYEDGFDLTEKVFHKTNLSIFTVSTKGSSYIRPVMLEKQRVNVGDDVNAFVFPRETFITQAAYLGGFIILDKSERIFLHDCKMHEYGYVGALLFNFRGHLIGLTYMDKGHFQAFSVLELQQDITNDINCAYVINGEPIGAPLTADAQEEE